MPDSSSRYNVFARRSSYGPRYLLSYRILTSVSWLLVVISGIYYKVHHPEGEPRNRLDSHPTPFSQTKIITGIYWILLLVSQLGYIRQLWSAKEENVKAAAYVAPYYIFNNLLVFAFILLWARNKYWGAEIIDIASIITQATVYWKNPGLPSVIHLPAVAAPYAWSLAALFWNGAVAVGGNSVPKRIVANIFIWVFFVVGQGHIIQRSDPHIGFSLSLLTLCKIVPVPVPFPTLPLEPAANLTMMLPALALKQLKLKIIALQWIFAFVIFGVFLISSIHSTATKRYNRDFYFRSISEPEQTDRERQPLLGE
ncbi:hypothetical protein FQN57_006554 [Myotisia sp. PD_48]|nr:hypothetical protein FQN57_006554 [Myotisia sp. PD_48]